MDPLDKKGSVGHQFTTDGKVGECPAWLLGGALRFTVKHNNFRRQDSAAFACVPFGVLCVLSSLD